MAQGTPPRRSARQPANGRHGYHDVGYQDGAYEDGAYADDGYQGDGYQNDPRPNYDLPRQPNVDDYDEDPPPWAGQSIYPNGPGGKERRPPPVRQAARRSGPPDQDWPEDDEEEDWPREEPGPGRGRQAATRARKSRRRLLLGGGLIVVAAVAVLAVLGMLPFQHQAAPSSDSGLVTTFQPGEFRSVPNTCTTVSAATLSQYLPGKLPHVAQSQGSAQSQCTWTLDARPNFRVLSVSTQAYAPSLLASGNGSATFNAIDAYNQQLLTLRSPPKSSKAPRAQLGSAVGLGRYAFTALQVFHVGGDTTDEVTVVVRDHNVLINVTMQGQQRGGGFGPVPVTTLRAAALAAAHEALAGIH